MCGHRNSDHAVRISVVALTVLVAGCASGWHANERLLFTCANGPDVTVVFRGDTVGVIGAQGGPMTLDRRARGTFVYESGTRSARLRGRNLFLTIGRMAPIRCRQAGRGIR